MKCKRVGLLCILLLGLGGCSGVISSKLVQASRPQAPFSEILSAPQKHLGRTVILGGSIIGIKEEGAGRTVLEVLQRPLGHHLRPQMGDKTEGRFLARIEVLGTKTKLEPKREITVAGTITSEETRPLDRTHYTYPVIQVEEYHLWRKWEPPVPPRSDLYGGHAGAL